MYDLKNHKITQNPEPWNIGIEKRLAILTGDASQKKIVYIYEAADTSTFRYRAFNMCQSLSYSKRYAGSFFFEKELPIVAEYLDYVDLVIFVRTRWSETMDGFFASIKKRNIRTLFDSDDLVFDIKALPLLMNTLNVDLSRPENYSYWFSYVSRLWLLGSMCDGLIGTNGFLAEKMSSIFKKPVFVINNFLNEQQIEISKYFFDEKNKKDSQGPFTIGYFSGSPSHINDFKKIAPEILELLKAHDDINLEVVGFIEFPDYLKKYIKAKRIIYKSLVDFLTLQKMVASVDVNVVPLVVNEFTNCKSELKFFESAIVGTITCASPIYSYKKSIRNGENGFLCNEGEWYSTIETIYKNKKDEAMILSANNYCLEKYSPKNQLFSIEKILDTFLNA